eukprot:scaffold7748_cov156-Amphora_coffeaeformis.AAC.1
MDRKERKVLLKQLCMPWVAEIDVAFADYFLPIIVMVVYMVPYFASVRCCARRSFSKRSFTS